MDDESFLRPHEIITNSDGAQKGFFVADFGCGHGYLTVPLARAVGTEGAVYAVDIRKEALSVVSSRAKRLGLPQVHVILGDLEKELGSYIGDHVCYTVFCVNLLFQIKNHGNVFKEARRVLKDNGRLVVVDWEDTSTPYCPSREQRINKESIIEAAKGFGFSKHASISAGKYHWGLLFLLK